MLRLLFLLYTYQRNNIAIEANADTLENERLVWTHKSDLNIDTYIFIYTQFNKHFKVKKEKLVGIQTI